MPRAIIPPNEMQERLKSLYAGEILPVIFRKNLANTGSMVNAAFASFALKQSYAVVGVYLSGVQNGVTTILDSLVVLSKSDLHNHYPTGGVVVGSEIASLVFQTESSKSIVFGSGGKYGEERHNVFLEKGQTLYAHLHSLSVTGISVAEIIAYLLPVGNQ